MHHTSDFVLTVYREISVSFLQFHRNHLNSGKIPVFIQSYGGFGRKYCAHANTLILFPKNKKFHTSATHTKKEKKIIFISPNSHEEGRKHDISCEGVHRNLFINKKSIKNIQYLIKYSYHDLKFICNDNILLPSNLNMRTFASKI